MYSEEQMKQFERDREFIAEGYREYNQKKAEEFSKPLPATPGKQHYAGNKEKMGVKGKELFSLRPRYRYPVLQQQAWIKYTAISLGVALLLTLLLSWFEVGIIAISFLVQNFSWEAIMFVVYNLPQLLSIASLLFLLYCLVFRPAKGLPENTAVLFSFPAVFLLPLVISSSHERSIPEAFASYPIGYRIAFVLAFLLAVAGFVLNLFQEKKKIEIPPDSFIRTVKKVFYYAFIAIGVYLACVLWNKKSLHMNADYYLGGGFGTIVGAGSKYLLAAMLLWIAFYRHQFIRVWFHLVAFYAMVVVALSYLLSGNVYPTAAFLMPFIVAGAALLAYLIGRRRKCPSCKSLYGKKLLSYSKAGSSSYSYKSYENKRVGDVRYNSSVPAWQLYGKGDNEYVSTEVTRNKTTYHYNTQNICKHCGHQWQDFESHDSWWYRPM